MKKSDFTNKEVEKLSNYVHIMWSNWFLYFIKNMWNPRNLIRWFKQSKTSYYALSEIDKNKDRKFAEDILKLLKGSK